MAIGMYPKNIDIYADIEMKEMARSCHRGKTKEADATNNAGPFWRRIVQEFMETRELSN